MVARMKQGRRKRVKGEPPRARPTPKPRPKNAPSATGADGRDATSGRFTPGNTHGQGNPLAKQQAEYRRAMGEAVSEKDLQAITRALVVRAKKGDPVAAKLVFEYLIGRPVPLVEDIGKDVRPIRIIIGNET